MEKPIFKEVFVQNTDYKMLRSHSDALLILPLSGSKTVLLSLLVVAAAYYPVFPLLKSVGTVTYNHSVQMFI